MKTHNYMIKSLEMQSRAKRLIPGMTQLLSKRPDRFSQGIWPGYFSKAKGAEIWDLDNNKYLDMSISGIGACILGYADPYVDSQVIEAIKKGVASSLNCPEEVELAQCLCDLHGWVDMVRFTRSGGEAMAVAIRIARAFKGRDKVAFCGYHGWHDWYLSANLETENALGEHLISGLDPVGVPKGLAGTALPFSFNRLDELESIVKANKKDLAAIVMEPIRNLDPDPDFIRGVRTLADESGAVLIMDEISAGLRFTTGGAHLVLHPVNPDIAVFSKALGNGYAIAAVIGSSRIMETAQKTFISSTNWTERIGPVAALATLKKHNDINAAEKLIALGTAIQEGWKEKAEKNLLKVEIGGIKPMGHFKFLCDDPLSAKAFFIQLMLEQGFLANTSYYAMAAHSENNVKSYLKAVDKAFYEISRALQHGNLSEKLKGEPSKAGFKRLN